MAVTIDLCAAASYGNTRAISCDPKRANFKSIIIGGAEFEPGDFASPAAFEAAFLAATLLGSSDSGKLFPFPEVSGISISTEANKEFTFGTGKKITISEGAPSYVADLYIGTNLERQLRKFNGQTVPVFVFDDTAKVWGKINTDGNFVGMNATLFLSGGGFGDYNTPGIAKLSISFASASDFYDYARFASTGFDVSDIVGLFDATLQNISHASNVYKIGAVVENTELAANKNLYDEYSTELASAALWIATNIETGADIPITSVAVDAALEAWTVTLDATAYGALTTGDKVKLELENPTVLAAAGVTDIESVPVVLTK